MAPFHQKFEKGISRGSFWEAFWTTLASLWPSKGLRRRFFGSRNFDEKTGVRRYARERDWMPGTALEIGPLGGGGPIPGAGGWDPRAEGWDRTRITPWR